MHPLILILFVCLYNFANGETVEQLVSDKGFWARMDWSNYGTSKLWKAGGWMEEKENDKDLRKAWQKKKAITIRGVPVVVGLIAGDKLSPRVVADASSISVEQCETLQKWGVAKFGKPSVLVDSTYNRVLLATDDDKTGILFRNYRVRAQWDIGPTRVDYDCFGTFPAIRVEGEEETVIGGFLISDMKSFPDLKPLTGIRCTRETASVNGNSVETKPHVEPFRIIDENQKTILSSDKIPWTGDAIFTDSKITLESLGGENSERVQIDRTSGKYHVKSIRKEGTVTVESAGTCEKETIGKRKF